MAGAVAASIRGDVFSRQFDHTGVGKKCTQRFEQRGFSAPVRADDRGDFIVWYRNV